MTCEHVAYTLERNNAKVAYELERFWSKVAYELERFMLGQLDKIIEKYG